MNSEIYEAEDRAKRVKRDEDKPEDKPDDREDKPCDVRAVVDAYREGLVNEDEARALMRLGKRAEDESTDEESDDRDDDTEDDTDE